MSRRKVAKAAPAGVPTRWVRGADGTPAYVGVTSDRDRAGDRVLRLRYPEGVTGAPSWTVPLLDAAGVRWLQHRPKDFPA